MVVVADTSPLNYLIQTDSFHVLPALYERVLVPSAVVGELRHPESLAAARAWLTRMPSWLEVREVAEATDTPLTRLDLGERQAIQLAKQEHADLLLMDEERGVRIAREQGLTVSGTLGVLVKAASRRADRHRTGASRSLGDGRSLQAVSARRGAPPRDAFDVGLSEVVEVANQVSCQEPRIEADRENHPRRSHPRHNTKPTLSAVSPPPCSRATLVT